MRAWVLHGAGDLRLEEVKKPVPGDKEVLVGVKAAGICGSDIPRICRTGAHTHPLIPGHEFSGVVEALGPGVSPQWQGRRVGIFPLLPCKICRPCQEKQYEMCRNYSYLGSRRDGGFAPYVSVPVWNLLPLPDEVTFEEAAMLEPMAVAVHALRRARVSPKETAAVCGLGTIGLLLAMFLKEAGTAAVLTIGNKEMQRQMVQRLGFPEDAFCDCRHQDAKAWLLERTAGRGADVFFECVGKKETCSLAIQNTAVQGKTILVGNPHSDMELEKEIYWKILRNQLRISGTWNSSFFHDALDDWHYVFERLEKKKISPADLITHRFALEELEKAVRIMENRTEDYVKMMLAV